MASDRFQQEIEEILQQSGDLPPPGRPKRSKPRQPRDTAGGGRLFTPGRLLLFGVLLLLTFALVFDGSLATVFLWAGIVIGVLGFATWLASADRASQKKLWRGRPVEYETHPSGPSLWDRLTRRFRR